jgi:16S rRNA (adenine1518-N6/adenine1519-N6)-dimethyltransferase
MRHTLAPRTRLGQHFLVDDNIARKIANSVGAATEDVVVEIGAGEGALTQQLVDKAGIVYALELDDRSVVRLREVFGERLRIVHGDALKVDLTAIASEHHRRLRVVGNIPYRITTPLLFHLFEHAGAVRDAVIMMQREVADRLTAVPRTKEYGVLSVATQFHCTVQRLFTVPPSCFLPPPKVHSTVVRFTFPDPAILPDASAAFRRVVRAAFGKRRKTLSNALKDMIGDPGRMAALATRMDLSRRAEELSILQFAELTALVAEVEQQ